VKFAYIIIGIVVVIGVLTAIRAINNRRGPPRE